MNRKTPRLRALPVLTGALVATAALLGLAFVNTDEAPEQLPASIASACHQDELVGDSGVLYPVRYPAEFAHCVAVMQAQQ